MKSKLKTRFKRRYSELYKQSRAACMDLTFYMQLLRRHSAEKQDERLVRRFGLVKRWDMAWFNKDVGVLVVPVCAGRLVLQTKVFFEQDELPPTQQYLWPE